ncbi:MAG: DUF421 domain-containing protein [Halothermotrichaceae bacterium]
MDILYITIELLFGFGLLFLVTKLLGKTQIKQITPFDFISALVMGELLGNAIYDKEIGLLYISYAVLLWGVLIYVIEKTSQKILKSRAFLDGNPSIIIRKGMIDRSELTKAKLNINRLQEMLREKDIFSIREVEYALLESSGTISVIKKSQYDSPTRQELNLPEQSQQLPVTMINDQEIMWDNLEAAGYNVSWLKKQLRGQGYKRVKEVFYAEWLEGKGLYIVPFEKEN